MPRLPNFGHFKLKIAIICLTTLMSLKLKKVYIIQIEFDGYSCCAIYYQGRDHLYITSAYFWTFFYPTHPMSAEIVLNVSKNYQFSDPTHPLPLPT